MTSVLGVDSSTQSTKVEIRDLASGELVASGRAMHPATTPPRSEQDPASWWAALSDAVEQCGDAVSDVVTVSVAGQQHGLVVLDEADEVLRPAKLWNDTESAPEADALVAAGGPAFWADACGSVPLAAFTITKLAWLAAHEPGTFARVRRVMLPHDWLTWKLTGEHVTDRGDASGTGWWSPHSECWRLDLLDRVSAGIDWAERLPRVVGPFEAVGETTKLGLHASVGPGTGDNMAAALGLGLVPGDVVISLGTSGTVYAASQTPTADPAGAVAGFADATGHFLPLVCTLNATKVTDTFAGLSGMDHVAFAQEALLAPDSGGMTLVPYLDGERTPNRPDATGTLSGLRTDTTRGQLARAVHEGVVCGLLDGLDALTEAGVPTADGRLVLIGGGARSSAYRQIFADLTQRTITVPEADELVALGACVQATAVAGVETAADVTARWSLGGGVDVEPERPAGDIRPRYAQMRG